MEQKQVAIVIPAYNYGKYLKETLESCYDQKFPLEIIVVDDGSTDNTREVCLEFLDKGLIYLYKSNTAKAAIARNYGIAHTSMPYIIPLDADDLLAPDFMEIVYNKFIAPNEYDLFTFDAHCFEEGQGPIFSTELDNRIYQGNNQLYCGVFRRTAWEAVGGYDEDIPFSGLEDWTLWIKMYRKGLKHLYENQELFAYRVHKDSMTYTSLIPHTTELRQWAVSKGYV